MSGKAANAVKRPSRAKPTYCEICAQFHVRGDEKECLMHQARAKLAAVAERDREKARLARQQERDEALRATAAAQQAFTGMFLPKLTPAVCRVDVSKASESLHAASVEDRDAVPAGSVDDFQLPDFDVVSEDATMAGAGDGGAGHSSAEGGCSRETCVLPGSAAVGVRLEDGQRVSRDYGYLDLPSWVRPSILYSDSSAPAGAGAPASGSPGAAVGASADTAASHSKRFKKMYAGLQSWVPSSKWVELGLAVLHCVDSFPRRILDEPFVGCTAPVCRALREELDRQYETAPIVQRGPGFRYRDVRGAVIDFKAALLVTEVELVAESLRRGLSKDDLRYFSLRDRFRPRDRPGIDRKVFMVSLVRGIHCTALRTHSHTHAYRRRPCDIHTTFAARLCVLCVRRVSSPSGRSWLVILGHQLTGSFASRAQAPLTTTTSGGRAPRMHFFKCC